MFLTMTASQISNNPFQVDLDSKCCGRTYPERYKLVANKGDVEELKKSIRVEDEGPIGEEEEDDSRKTANLLMKGSK